jgi:hypothetical protein
MKGLRPVHLLLLIPYAAVLCVPLYNRAAPDFAWIPLGSLLLVLFYRAETRAK